MSDAFDRHNRRLTGRRDQRHVDGEHAALARLAFDADVAAMQAGESPREGETEAGALLLPIDAGVDLLELVKDPGLVRQGDADSGVGNRDLDGADEPHGRDANQAT